MKTGQGSRIYLFPLIMRKEQPIKRYVQRDKNSYWLCIQHDNDDKGKHQSVSKVRISETFFNVFRVESLYNRRKYKVTNSPD